jgi:hypothetical protein
MHLTSGNVLLRVLSGGVSGDRPPDLACQARRARVSLEAHRPARVPPRAAFRPVPRARVSAAQASPGRCRVVSLTCQRPSDELPVRAVLRGLKVDDLADGGGVLVSGDDKGARRDRGGVASLVEEGP